MAGFVKHHDGHGAISALAGGSERAVDDLIGLCKCQPTHESLQKLLKPYRQALPAHLTGIPTRRAAIAAAFFPSAER
jgi:hypothetical protein